MIFLMIFFNATMPFVQEPSLFKAPIQQNQGGYKVSTTEN